MNLDLRPLLKGETARMGVDIFIEPEAPAGVELTDRAHLVGEVTNRGGYMRLAATATVPYRGACARCLDPVSGVFSIPFERTVVTEGTLTEEQLEEDVDEYLVLNDGMLDADDAVREALILSFPMRLNCGVCLTPAETAERGGLCPVCGKPLREGACGCVTREVDPRWAPLAALRFDDEEEAENN